MSRLLENAVRRLARNRCEYCRMPDGVARFPHVLDHVIARQHGGKTVLDNLALCCGRCNQFKGPNIAGIDPHSGALSRLFHPRRDRWAEHFRWRQAVLVGRTPVGRTTITVLAINDPVRVAARRALMHEGIFG